MEHPPTTTHGASVASRLHGRVVVVTGAAGYLGRELCKALLGAGCAQVRAVDVSPTVVALGHARGRSIMARVCDVTDAVAMVSILEGADAIVHTASFGMSGPSMLDAENIHHVNVEGTKQLLALAESSGAKAFVYTSSYNAAFGGQEIVNGDEDVVGWFPPDQQVDAYSQSKTLAEQAVLSSARFELSAGSDSGASALLERGTRGTDTSDSDANSIGGSTYGGSSSLSSGDNGDTDQARSSGLLRRCAIRPAAIFGPDEERHIPRIVNLVHRGLVRVAIGPPDTRVDWVYIDNLVLAHVLALANLLSDKPTAHMQAFCISDDHPVNQFEFLSPLFEAVGGRRVIAYVPTRLVYAVAWMLEKIYAWPGLRWLFDYVPLLTRAEVNKVGVTHYFSMAKARRVLGYEPLVAHPHGLHRTVARWAEREQTRLVKLAASANDNTRAGGPWVPLIVLLTVLPLLWLAWVWVVALLVTLALGAWCVGGEAYRALAAGLAAAPLKADHSK